MLSQDRKSSQTCNTASKIKAELRGPCPDFCNVWSKHMWQEISDWWTWHWARKFSECRHQTKEASAGTLPSASRRLRLDGKNIFDVSTSLCVSREQFCLVPKSLNHLNSKYHPFRCPQTGRGREHVSSTDGA